MVENIRQDTDKGKQGFEREYERGKNLPQGGQGGRDVNRDQTNQNIKQGGSGGMGRREDYPSKEIGKESESSRQPMDEDVDFTEGTEKGGK